jgi:hypothetical protein
LFYENNLTPNNQYGVRRTDTFGDPLLTLATYLLQGGNSASYPPDKERWD